MVGCALISRGKGVSWGDLMGCGYFVWFMVDFLYMHL